MIVSTDPSIRALISRARDEYPWLKIEQGRRHWRLRSERSRDFIPIPFSPSDRHRVLKNLWAQIRRLAELGLGLIASKRR